MKVIHATLHSAVNFHGSEILGDLTLDVSKVKGLSMWTDEDDQILYIKTPKMTARGLIGFMPVSNIKNGYAIDDAQAKAPQPDAKVAAAAKLKAL